MQASPKTQEWATSLLAECHELVQSRLATHLRKVFENSNLAFLEFAEKAQSSASQIQFMEAMTVIQRNRGQVEEIFYRVLAQSFRNLGSVSPSGEPYSPAALTLLSKEDADIEVAIKNMASTASSGAANELAALRQRIAVLNNGRKVDDAQLPGSPLCLANAFHAAATALVLEHETMLIVYMLFDKFVLSKLGPLYAEYNERLVKAGVLPNLKYEVKKHPIKPGSVRAGTASENASQPAIGGSENHTNSAGSHGQSLGDELFGNIMRLLAGRETNGNTQGDRVVSNPLPQTTIVTAIDKVQHTTPVDNLSAEHVVTIAPGTQEHGEIIPTISHQLLQERERLFEGIDRRRIPVADTRVIDLVGMMFEFLLRDEDIPNVAKAELSRLHTPYLKVAIIDKRFFSDTQHPANELLNALADAATRWVFEDDLERGIFPSIRYIVQRVIDDFANNIELFSELLGLFNRSLNELVDKASAIEERTRQAAAGKEKLGAARDFASKAIDHSITGRNVPPRIKALLRDTWLDKLMFIYLREPDANNSSSWQLAIRTIEDIIWSVETRHTEADQADLRVKLPMLNNRLEQALTDLESFGTSENQQQLKTILDCQQEALRQPVDEQLATGTKAPGIVNAEQEDTDTDDITERDVSIEDVVNLDPAIQKARDRLTTVAFGTWFHIQENNRSHPVRIKLSWYSKMSGNYMFVDSMGVKSVIWDRDDLAEMIADGRARIISDSQSPFVRRALMAIRKLLTGD